MKTIVINLIAAPGTGKSTVASELFAKMKWAGYDVELVSEYAKELVWEERNETFKNELYLFAKQHHRMFRLRDKVQYIVTDRPLLLSLFYNKKYGDNTEAFSSIVREEIQKFQNINVFLHRTKEYVAKGRNQTEEESDAFAMEINQMILEKADITVGLSCQQDWTSEQILKYVNVLEIQNENKVKRK